MSEQGTLFAPPVLSLWQITLPNACYAVEVEGGIVTGGAPMGRWAFGKPLSVLVAWARRQGGTCVEISG